MSERLAILFQRGLTTLASLSKQRLISVRQSFIARYPFFSAWLLRTPLPDGVTGVRSIVLVGCNVFIYHLGDCVDPALAKYIRSQKPKGLISSGISRDLIHFLQTSQTLSDFVLIVDDRWSLSESQTVSPKIFLKDLYATIGDIVNKGGTVMVPFNESRLVRASGITEYDTVMEIDAMAKEFEARCEMLNSGVLVLRK